MAKDDKNVNITFKVTADTTNLDDVANKVKQVMEQAVKKTQLVKIDADTSEAEGKIAGISKRIDLANRYDKATINIKANDTDAVKTINELQDKIKGLTVKLDTSKLKSQLNEKLQELNNDESLKKVKLGVNTKSLLTEVNKAITSINNDESLKKLKLGVDGKYLQTQLNKAVKELDATVKLKTKLDTSSRRSDTKGTVTTTKTSKEESDAYQSLFSKRASAIQNMDKAYQEFGRDSKELRGAFKEFLSASREMRKFGRDTGVLSLNKINSDLERLIGANLSNDFVKNALMKERDKILRDRDALDRTLNPDKYAKLEAKAIFDSLSASLKDFSATVKQITGEVKKSYADQVNSKYNPNAIKNNMFSRSTYDQVFNDPSLMNKDLATGFVKLRKAEEAAAKMEKLEYEKYLKTSAKEDLSTMSHMAKASGIFNEEDFNRFKSRLEEYRSLIDNFNTNFYKKIGKELGITDESHPFYKELQKMYQKEKATDKKWDEQPAELANKEADAQAKVTGELKSQSALLKDKILAQKQLLADLAKSAKEDKVFDKDKAGKFFDELQAYRDLTQNYSSSFLLRTGKQLGITNEHPYFAGMKTAFESARKQEQEWYKKPITAEVDVKGSEKVEELNQKILTTTQQFMYLRGEALKAGNALNQATDPKDLPKLRAEFEKAIQALVNYQRATRGLTKGGEAQLVEKLAVGSIKEQTEAYKVLYEWIKKAVQAQRDLDIGVGRRNPPKSKDTDLMSWIKNMDIGRAVAGMAYAARGELNTVQAFGNLLSSMSQISGVVSTMAKGLGALALAGLAVYAVINSVETAFTKLTDVLGQVATAIYNILRPGIELYKQRQTAELAVAAAISSRAREEGQQVTFERGLEISKELMQRVIIDAAKSAFNPQELIDALRGTLPLAFGKGMNLEQAYDLTKGVASVAKVINLAPNQVLQELRDILQGTISARSSQVAGATGMTGEELREAEAQGRLYEYISEHLKNFTIALNKYAETLAGALDRLSETWAMGMEAVFSRIAPVANNLINAFVDNFIGRYRDKVTGEFIDTSNSENLINPETGEYRELEPVWSDFIEQFSDSLVELVEYLAPIVDEILNFVKELTNEEDAMKAVTSAIKYAIRFTVTFGEILASVMKAIIVTLETLEAPISWVLGLIVGLSKAIYHFGAMCVDLSVAIGDAILILKKALMGDVSFKDLENSVKLGDKVANSFESMMTDLKESVTTTSYDELFGIDTQKIRTGGKVTELVDAAIAKAKAEEGKQAGKPVDYSAVQGMAKEDAKQSYADQRKALQAFIEDLKQTLKEAIADIKDRMEQNDLAYQQGYKSIEEYFTQKSQLEYEEAQFRLQTLIAERNAIASLTPTNDSERYQWQRDLIKTDGEIALAQREANKKQDQLVELAGAIERQLSIRPYQQGLGYNNTNRNVTPSYSVGSNNDLGQAMVDLAESSEWATKEMYHAGEGCVEFVTTFGAQFSDLLKEAADNQVWGMSTGTNDITPWLEEHGVQVEYNVPIELAKEIAKAGDIIAVNAGIHAAMAIGDGRVLHNSSSSYRNGDINHVKNVEMDLWDDDTVNIIRTSETMGQNITSLSNATEQLSQEAKDATTKIEQTRKDIAVSYEELQKRMPQAFSKNVQAYLQASQDGQTRWLEAVKNYNLAINNNENMLIAVEASIASVATKLGREAQIMRSKYGQQFPELADALDKMIPIELLKAEAKVWEQYANNRLQMIEDDSKAINKRLREKSMLYPQAIEQYMSYFQNLGEYTITEQLQQMSKVADELAKQGAISEARNISKKIIEMRSKFSNMIQSWIDEMGNYFNYRKELVNADSGLTSFVKEERVKQFEKGEARVKAVAYGQEAMEWAKLEITYQEQLNKIIEGRTDELDQTLHTDQKLLEMDIADVEILRQKAMRQAEINAKLGEQKTLWQETMDAANQALENGLYNFMTDYINTAESIGEAFRNMAIDILKDLQKFFAKKAITDLMHVITGTPNEQYNAPNTAEVETAINTQSMISWLSNIYYAIQGKQALNKDINATDAVSSSTTTLGVRGKGEEVGIAQIGQNTSQMVANQTQTNGLLTQLEATENIDLAEQQVDNITDQEHDIQDSVTQQQQLMNQEQINMTEQRREHEDKRHNMQTESNNVVGNNSVGMGGNVSPFTTGVTNGAGNTGLTNSNFLSNFMNSPIFGGLLDFVNSIFGSALGQIAGLGLAIDSIMSGDKKEQLLGTIFIELQLIYQTLVQILTNISMMGTMFYNNGMGYATGGYISGKGTSTSDSIPAMLSNGEYVIKADAVKRYGLNFLDAVNNGHFTRMRTVIPRFADGGYVGDALQDTARGMTDFAKNLGTSVGVDNTISIALVRDEQEAIREWAKSPSGGQKFLVDFAKGNGRVFSRFNR